jgi:hypothetical protein
MGGLWRLSKSSLAVAQGCFRAGSRMLWIAANPVLSFMTPWEGVSPIPTTYAIDDP